MGRKKKYIDAQEVEWLAGEGLAAYQIADQLGVCADTFLKRKRENTEIADAPAWH